MALPSMRRADGTVTESDDSGWGGGYGYHITIRHNGTYSTRYAHMSKLSVRVGASVSKGHSSATWAAPETAPAITSTLR